MLSFKAYVVDDRVRVTFIAVLALACLMEPLGDAQTAAWHSDQVIHLTGFPDVREKAKGSLSIVASPATLVFATPGGSTSIVASPATLVFATPGGSTSIDRSRIFNVTLGNERMETGGTAGRVTRAIIPFGGGAAVATMTNKQVGLLTIEFLGEHDALHGVVFLLPVDDASRAYELRSSPGNAPQIKHPDGDCESPDAVHPHAIQVAPITTLGEPVPAEYKVLLYERLVNRLQERGAFAGIYRDGDGSSSASCPEYRLALTLKAFKKGNAAVRASTGPVGFFVGTTSLTFHVQVRDVRGKIVLDKDFKASQRGDSESLDVAGKIANRVTKQLRRSNAHSPWS